MQLLARTWWCVVGMLCASILSTASAAERPNFVIINIDDLGYADIGAFGSTLNRTPSLDRMAREGMRFTTYYAAPVCSPSRAALMTGCHPKRVLQIPGVLFPGDAEGLNKAERTVASLLKQQGYATMCIGKWHLGDQPEFLPTRHGFDHYFGIPYSNDMGPAADGARSNLGEKLPQLPKNGRDHPPLPLLRDEQVVEHVRAAEQRTLVSRYTDEAVQFIRASREGPFFLYLAHNAVHFPLYPSAEFEGRSGHGLYSDWVEEVDASVGRVLDALRAAKLDERTLVLFTSDNGGTPRTVNAPLRGNKASTWEGGMREPTIFWWPGHVQADATCSAVTSMMDILPTFVTLAGGTPPGDRRIDGHDIAPLLTGATDVSPYKAFYYFKGLKLEAVRRGPWKLHLAKVELYDLVADVGEATNVAASNPEIVAELKKIADAMNDDLGVDGIGPGCRPMGVAKHPQPLIAKDGTIRGGFKPE